MITLKLNLFRIFVLSAISFTLFTFTANPVFSQSPTPAGSSTPAADIKFPVKELGSCIDLGSCTKYCEDPVNQNSCVAFAKEHGFYKDDKTTYTDSKLIENAKKELGCDSKDACLNFCADPAHQAACDSWAKRNEIPGGYTDQPDKPQYIEKAKEVLGCNSADSCATLCDNTANADKCGKFADEVGLIGGNVKEGPGGCQTPESFGAFCSDPANFDKCKKQIPSGNFAGPGGCTSEETCRSFCDQNPDQCRSIEPGSNGAYVPIECASGESHGPGGACTKIVDVSKAASCVGSDKYWDGSACQDKAPVGIDPTVPNAHFEGRPEMGNCDSPGSCYDYCKGNPGKCQGFDATTSRPTDEYNPYVYYTPGTAVKIEPVKEMGNCDSPGSCYDYCKGNPGKCQGFSDKAPRPPEIYIPGTYYTPPADIVYVTPPTTGFYTTPIYFTPPQGSTYTTPQYYTPGTYSTPTYQTPPSGSNYSTPTYYTPGTKYSTPTGNYPTPTYMTPSYFTPPALTGYNTPYYYTPASYTTPFYYTPGTGGISSNYTTPNYQTPPPYTSPQYYTPYTGTGKGYTTPTYYTPITYNTPYYATPPKDSNYTTPNYYTPPINYTTPKYYTPGTYPSPVEYTSPPPYATPNYQTPPTWFTGVTNYVPPKYGTPQGYPTPPQYVTPPQYATPYYNTPYTTPSYPTPPAGSPYTSPSYPTPQQYQTPPPYNYPTPGTPYTSPTAGPNGGYGYPTPAGTYTYPTPGTGSSYLYPAPSTTYLTPAYSTPPAYATPPSTYTTPPAYGTPTYETPTYNTPSYSSPPAYSSPPPGEVHGATTSRSLLQQLWDLITGK